MILETTFTTNDGEVRLIDYMPPRGERADVVRVVEGVRGRVTMNMELIVRFDYGSAVPWVRRINEGLLFIAGPDALILSTPVNTSGRNFTTVATFDVSAGDRTSFVLTWFPSHRPPPSPIEVPQSLADTEQMWNEWSARCKYQGPWREQVIRSLLTLKALTFGPTGGVIAAATTSLPETLGGVRNWDYRYCWIRDATFTLYALMISGYADEACAWRDWLLRAVAGHPKQMQIMYGPAGERRLTELELSWLPGYANSAPVRIGNAASGQFQLDVYGEVMDSMHQARRVGISESPTAWSMQRKLLDFLEGEWKKPDDGIWEVRGERQHFTHSKMMAWVAFDRAVKAIDRHGRRGPRARWMSIRDDIHREVCEKAWDADRGTFTQFYGSRSLDASVLMMPLVGFLPATDPRMQSTVDVIQRELMADGFVRRYSTVEEHNDVDGLPGREGAFLPCTFWLVDNLAMMGRTDEARAMFERLLGLTNDVGLLAEEYDPVTQRQMGNFPQAFTHVGLVNSAVNLSPATPGASPVQQRSDGENENGEQPGD